MAWRPTHLMQSGERAFELTEDQWKEQAMQNANEFGHFMAQLGDALEQRGK